MDKPELLEKVLDKVVLSKVGNSRQVTDRAAKNRGRCGISCIEPTRVGLFEEDELVEVVVAAAGRGPLDRRGLARGS